MTPVFGLVKGTGTDADTTISTHLSPVFVAFHMVLLPEQYATAVKYARRLKASLTEWYRFRWTILSAFLTYVAELGYSPKLGLVRFQRQVSNNLRNPATWAVQGMD